MSQDNTEQNRSEAPSPFKLKRAREKGSIARGMDLGFLTGLVAFLVWAWIFGHDAAGEIALAARGALVTAPGVASGPGPVLAIAGTLLVQTARPLMFMAAAIFGVVLVFEFLQTGPVFTFEPLKLDFNRLNPGQNLKKLFTFRILVETGKNVLKLAVYAVIAWLVIKQAMTVTAHGVTDAASLAAALWKSGLKFLLFAALAALFFAALDQGIVRRDFLKKMRMSRREMRRESRDREGDPRMKQRRKQLHREFVKLSQSLRGIRGADVLITNPTHYAVALRYDRATMQAPMVVSRGSNQIALRLRRLAFLYGVVVVPDPELARALYFKSDLDTPVPEPLYRRVADVYLAIRKRKDA